METDEIQRRYNDSQAIKIAKNITYLLKHGVAKEGLHMDKDGFVNLDEILAKDYFTSNKVSVKRVTQLVENDTKKRFEIISQDNDGNTSYLIRATPTRSGRPINDEKEEEDEPNPRVDVSEEENKTSEHDATKQPIEHFDYLCILDFEAQCSKTDKLSVQEIIEFPVVIVDIANKTILQDKFHYYVKPVVHPQLFPFCTELTGITQDKVDSGIELKEVLERLDAFLKEKQILETRFCFVTCGDWDLNICLRKESSAKNIEVRDYLKKWINLKKVYPVPTGSFKSGPAMAAMLKLSNLELLGKHHSGIDDAKNIARVVVYLLEKGFKFKKHMVARVG